MVIAACDGVCPVVTGKRYENWGISDPYGLPIDSVRPIRDEIAHRVNDLVASLRLRGDRRKPVPSRVHEE